MMMVMIIETQIASALTCSKAGRCNLCENLWKMWNPNWLQYFNRALRHTRQVVDYSTTVQCNTLPVQYRIRFLGGGTVLYSVAKTRRGCCAVLSVVARWLKGEGTRTVVLSAVWLLYSTVLQYTVKLRLHVPVQYKYCTVQYEFSLLVVTVLILQCALELVLADVRCDTHASTVQLSWCGVFAKMIMTQKWFRRSDVSGLSDVCTVQMYR